VIAGSSADALLCAGDADRLHFRLDLRDNTLAVRGPAAAGDARWLTAAVGAHARSQYRPGAPFAALLGPAVGLVSAPAAAAGTDRLVVYSVKYAPHQAPVAAYGFVTCAAALGDALLPAWRRAGVDSLLALAVVAADGRELVRSAPQVADEAPRAVAVHEVGGISLRATLTPAAAQRIVVRQGGRPGLPLLLGFLTLTAALAAVALAQLRREQELARLRADFTSSVSHELRTPLAQILLFGETHALDRVRSADERRAAAETIVQEARRLLRLVENVLHFAQAERGAVQLEPRPTPLAPLLASVAAAFAPVAEAARAQLATALDDDAIALADAPALRQIVLNLLDNAVKYGPPGQIVMLGADSAAADAAGAAGTDGWTRVWVEDGGPGVPESDRERIWAPFVRLVRDRNAYDTGGQARTGSGIGLSVVRDLTTLMGGRAWVEPGVRGGARFVVELPAAPRHPPRHPGEPGAEAGPPTGDGRATRARGRASALAHASFPARP
jgi:signal transduction histidine kinase